MSALNPLADVMFAREQVSLGTARAIRERHGLSRGEIAAAIGVSAGAVSLWERKKRRPHGDKGARYGRILRELDRRTAIAPTATDVTGAS